MSKPTIATALSIAHDLEAHMPTPQKDPLQRFRDAVAEQQDWEPLYAFCRQVLKLRLEQLKQNRKPTTLRVSHKTWDGVKKGFQALCSLTNCAPDRIYGLRVELVPEANVLEVTCQETVDSLCEAK